MTKNKISINLLAVFSILIISISLVQAAVVFSTGAATNIIVSKVLAASPQGQAVLTAYSWATNPESSAINLLDPTGNVYNALKVVQGADPLQMLGGMAISKAQGEVLGKIYESLPPEQKIAFLNAQEYASYAQQVFKYQPDSADAKKLMEQASYDNKTGILKLKIPDGKGGYKDFISIPKGWSMQSKEGIMTLTSSTIDQQFKFMDSVSAYLQKNGTIKIQGQEIREADFITAKESRLKFGNNQLLSVPANTSVRYKSGVIEIEGKTFKYGNENINILEGKLNISGNKISGKKFEINGINLISEHYDTRTEIEIKDFGYSLLDGKARLNDIEVKKIGQKGMDIYLDGKNHEGNYISINQADKKMVIGTEDIRSFITFLKNNSIIPMDSETDLVSMEVRSGTIEIKNKNDFSKITMGPDSDYDIHNGLLNFRITRDDGDDVRFRPPYELGHTSAPISLEYEITCEEDGEEKIEKERVFINNYNEFYSLDENEKERAYFKRQYPLSNLKYKYKNIAFRAPSGEVAKELDEYLGQLNNNLRDSIKKITVQETKSDLFSLFSRTQVAAFIKLGNPSEITLNLPTYNLGRGDYFLSEQIFDFDTLVHEAAHSKTFDLIHSRVPGSKDEITKLVELINEGKLLREDANTKLYKIIEKDPFIKEWKNIAGNVYVGQKWQGLSSNEASSRGCIDNYGCSELVEDIATYTALIYKSPHSLQEKVNSTSKDYDPRCINKVNLLKRYGFIKEEDYNYIFKNVK